MSYHYIDSAQTALPVDSMGNPWNGTYVTATGNLKMDIRADQASSDVLRAAGVDITDGVISSKGSTNFSQVSWHGFDIRGALQARIGLPVVYNNDANAAALYAHHRHFGAGAMEKSSVAAIVGTGLGGGVIESGRIVKGATGMAGELGHIQIPMDGLLVSGVCTPNPFCRRHTTSWRTYMGGSRGR